MNGILLIDKPRGLSSHAVVEQVRRFCGGVKAGHCGTLDPLAEGVLPICLGRATRVVEYMAGLDKRYTAAVVLGRTTDTEDSTGQVLETRPVPPLKGGEVKQILSAFTGSIKQRPPLYSAVKYRGKPLYYWARRGEDPPRQARMVEIYDLELLHYEPSQEPQLHFSVHCSKGTYVRTLAAAVGERIGCGAHLAGLVRTAAGPFTRNMAYTLAAAREKAAAGSLPEILLPMDSALDRWPRLEATEEAVKDLGHGRPALRGFSLPPGLETGSLLRVYGPQGTFVALARLEQSAEKQTLRTVKYLDAGNP